MYFFKGNFRLFTSGPNIKKLLDYYRKVGEVYVKAPFLVCRISVIPLYLYVSVVAEFS